MKKGYIFVFIQFTLLILIFITGPNIPENIFLLSFFILGIIIGLLAIWNMRVSKLRTEPEIAEGSKLVTSGIYKFIRHPMYSGLILVSFALVLDYFTYLRLLLFFLLLANQYLKLSYEEKLLEIHFKDYKSYKKKTKRLVPFIF